MLKHACTGKNIINDATRTLTNCLIHLFFYSTRSILYSCHNSPGVQSRNRDSDGSIYRNRINIFYKR